MRNRFDKYFLASNSFEGFVSHFCENYFPQNGWKCYIIKGGPGTGKSSFMKYIASKAMDKGYFVTLCPCSSDPDSLDGVIIKDKKILIVDGTSPHTLEPKYPGVCEETVDLGAFWDSKKLENKRFEIINATNINKAFHKTAAAFLFASREILEDTLITAKSFFEAEKAEKFAKELIDEFVPEKKKQSGTESIRFTEGVTPKGIVGYSESLIKNVENAVIIEDKIGLATDLIYRKIRRFALENGYEIITVKNAFLPSRLIDHIIIPELGIAFLRESEYLKFNPEIKRIHQRRFYNSVKKREKQARLTFNKKVQKELLLSAVDILQKAKISHDILEKFYTDAMNFEKMTEFSQKFTEKLLK